MSWIVKSDGKVYCTACKPLPSPLLEMVAGHGFVREEDSCLPTYVCPICKNIVIAPLGPEDE